MGCGLALTLALALTTNPSLTTNPTPTTNQVRVGAAAPSGGTWIFGGLGSRGLIHHALLGAAVAEAVLEGDEMLLPEHTRRCQLKLPRLAWIGPTSGDGGLG